MKNRHQLSEFHGGGFLAEALDAPCWVKARKSCCDRRPRRAWRRAYRRSAAPPAAAARGRGRCDLMPTPRCVLARFTRCGRSPLPNAVLGRALASCACENYCWKCARPAGGGGGGWLFGIRRGGVEKRLPIFPLAGPPPAP